MTPKRLANFRLEDELLEGLQTVKEREGLSLTVQVKIAVRDWLEREGCTRQVVADQQAAAEHAARTTLRRHVEAICDHAGLA